MYKFNAPLFVELHALLGFDTITKFLADWGKSRKSYDTILRGAGRLRVLLELANRYHFDPTVFFYEEGKAVPASRLMEAARCDCEWEFAFSVKGAFPTPTVDYVKWYNALLYQPTWRNRALGALNTDPEKCTMTVSDVLHVCNEYGVEPGIFFVEVKDGE